MGHSPDDVFAHFYIDGEWRETYDGVNLSARARGNDSIRITRGGTDQFSSIVSQSANFTLNNGDNFFTDDDPNSSLYRKFGENTRCRFGVAHPTRGLDLYARFSDSPAGATSGEQLYTVDKASLDVTGDLDIRWEMDIRGTRETRQILLSKYATGSNQRSWLIWMNRGGYIGLRTTTDGSTGTILDNETLDPMVAEREGRSAYRVTLDVNNGAGGHTYTWYTSDSIEGTWTQFATETVAGTTSVHGGTANVAVGSANGGSSVFASYTAFAGKMYRFELRNGIGGTVVADFDPNQDAQLGDTTWVDTCASPNTWLIAAGSLSTIRLGSDRVRFTGENKTRPDDWDGTGTDRWCGMTAQGTLSRYSSKRADIKSTSRRYWTRQDGIIGYWPCEDGSGAVQVSSAIDPGIPAAIVECSFTGVEGFAGSDGCLVLETAGTSSAMFVANTYSDTGAWGFIFYFNLDDLPVSTAVLANIYPRNSTVRRWVVNIGGTSFDFQAISPSGAVLDSAGVSFGGPDPRTGWVALGMMFKQEGGNIRWETTWHQVGSTDTFTHNPGGDTFAGTVGTLKEIFFNPTDAAYANARISQVIMTSFDYELFSSEFSEVSRAFSGETFGERWKRLNDEEGIACEWVGQLGDTEVVGPQPVDTLYSIHEQGAKLDGGLIFEARDSLEWVYVTGKSLGNRKRLELSYSDSHLTNTPKPTGDGRYTLNDFTASREGGGSARYEATDNRRKNVREPDDASPGVGRVERSDTYNANDDDRMYYIASNRVHLGTWDERIIPEMTVSTHRSEISSDTSLLADIFSQDIGDAIAIVDTAGSPLPPNDANCATMGCTEVIKNMTHDISFNTVPSGPYQVAILDSESQEHIPLLDVAGSETTLDGALNTTATSVSFKTLRTALAPIWVDDTNYPDDIGGGLTLDIDINGEIVRATSITAPTSDATYNYQTATVTRSVNSVVKSHADGTVIKLADVSYLGRI